MMQIAKDIGNMSWEEVSALRKGASKNMGTAFMAQYRDKFLEGATSLTASDASALWAEIEASGGWSFNKSHAVSYGIISYWTLWLKYHFPLSFAVAVMNNTRDEDTKLRYLREIVSKERVEMVPYDPYYSKVHWSTDGIRLIGGLTNINGIAEKKAAKVLDAREKGIPLPAGLERLLENPVTPYDDIFPTWTRYGHYYNDPLTWGLHRKPEQIEEVNGKGNYLFLGKIISVKANESGYRFIVEDDTDQIACKIDYDPKAEIVEDKWVIVIGSIRTDEWRTVSVKAVHHLD